MVSPFQSQLMTHLYFLIVATEKNKAFQTVFTHFTALRKLSTFPPPRALETGILHIHATVIHSSPSDVTGLLPSFSSYSNAL